MALTSMQKFLATCQQRMSSSQYLTLCMRHTHFLLYIWPEKGVSLSVLCNTERGENRSKQLVCCMGISAALMMTIPSQSKQNFKCITQ